MNETRLNPTSALSAPLFLSAALTFCLGLSPVARAQQAGTYSVTSPDGTVRANVTIGDRITYAVDVDGKPIVRPSAISMTVDGGRILGRHASVAHVKRTTIDETLKPVVREKFATIRDHCHELTLAFQGDYALTIRAYDNGVAYRFETSQGGRLTVVAEQARFTFAGDNQVYFPEEDSFFSHNERVYVHTPLNELTDGALASLPLLVTTAGPKVLITESALRDYPGMWVRRGKGNTLEGAFPPYALESKLKPGSDRDMPVTRSADYIAKTDGTRSFPWRILAIARTDADLITNQLSYQLADEPRIDDPSWIKPGKVAWDWWNANNVYGVDFRAGVNTETYKYYIDFAARHGLEYVILDEGWYKLGNLLEVVPEIDMRAIIDHAKKNKVRVILWVIWKTLDDQLQEALDQFEKWGVAGIKVDFMQREDQEMVNYYWRVAKEAAKRRMLVDFHGAHKPAGLRRAYPNVITREGVKGLENNKWSKDLTPTHNLMLPFIRMVAGPMDYTPGAMVNAQPKNFQPIFDRPMSQGTRAHQIAMYVLYESPLQMLADSPSNYEREPECTAFIAQIPTTWDDTHVLEASVGEYLVVARRHGATWYVGGMTNEKSREFTLRFPFLNGEEYGAEIIEDGINADRFGSDFRRVTRSLSRADSLKIKMTTGGGWAAILKPVSR